MSHKILPLPSYESIKAHVIKVLSVYCSRTEINLEQLSVQQANDCEVVGGLRLVEIQLPKWAVMCGVEGKLLVPNEACANSQNWQQVDWWLAVFLLLECWHERTWELNHGTIHSYSFRLEEWDQRAWDYPWVNLIAIFLREWCHRQENKITNQSLFGVLPKTQIVMTHDVDAINKTVPIRIKQSLFNIFNAGKYLRQFNVVAAFGKIKTALRFLFGQEDWWTFDQVLALEKNAGINAHFNFYADNRKQTLKAWLFDPGYAVSQSRVQELIKKIEQQNGIVGLHPTYDAWNDPKIIVQQSKHLSSVRGKPITSCRQHWLRFSWQSTWAAQEAAGLTLDTTLMFNDRAGFRNSAALVWNPWNQNTQEVHQISVQPSVFMDSHFYDYHALNSAQRTKQIRHWIEKVQNVHGQIAVLWHPHTLTKDYGWMNGFHAVIDKIKETT